MTRKILFESSAFTEFNEWASSDKKIYSKIVTLIKDIETLLVPNKFVSIVK